MNGKSAIFLGVSVVALIGALVAGYFVFFGGTDRPDAQGSTDFTSVEAQPDVTDEPSSAPEKPSSAVDSSSAIESSASETPRDTDSREPQDSAESTLPQALADADLIPARAVCDGTPVLIVESVLDDGSGAQAAERLPQVLDTYSDSVFYAPGACPSLRARFEGQDVYPVVQVFDSEAALCEAWASRGGNARLLNDDTSYSSPC